MARASATAGPPEFLARERELEHLLALFEDASSGATRFAVVTGEPGIGKTRLVTEVCARLTDRASDHWASCYEGQPSHWCWIKLLQELDSPPQVTERLRTSYAGTDEAARFDSLVALAGALGAAAEVQLLLLVLDDVHLADEASLGALSFVGRELRGSPIMLMAAYRDVEVRRGHPLAKTLGELAREQLAERITLTGLSADSVARLLESTAGLDPSAVAIELHERTHGNPLFVGEFGRLAAAAGAFDAGRLPEGIRDVIGLRLDRLDESQVALLRTAAVIGESFAASRLSTVAEEPDPGPALRPAVDVGLLALAEDLRSYRFTHGLIRETLLGELPVYDRASLHARVADAIQDEQDSGAAELAAHLENAGALADPTLTCDTAQRAGDEALGALAYEEARHWFELALRCKPAAERDLQRARLYFGLSCCQPARAVFHYGREAFELFMELGATDEAIRVAARPAALIWGDRGAWQEHIVEQALALSPPGAQLGWLHARRGETAWFVRGDRETAERSLADAIEIGRAEGDLDLRGHALRDLRLPGLSGSQPLHDLRRKIDHPVYQMELEHADIWGALRDGEDQRVLDAAP